MEWSGQQSQAPQHASQPVVGSMPPQDYVHASPLQGPALSALPPGLSEQPLSNAPGQLAVQPVGVTPSAVAGTVAAMPPLASSGAAVAHLNDDTTDADDAEWVGRAKRAIAGTHGDPHRQVQLIQHLRSQYLKQRFGRTVHTDET